MSRTKYVQTLVLLISTIGSIRAQGNPRIVNGENAEYGQFPYQALLLIQFQEWRALCGGSLISTAWVLTAGHCAEDALSVTVRLGMINRNGTDEDGSDDGSLVLVSEDLFTHPNYNSETLENDIALIHLPENVKFTYRISPAELPIGHDSYQGRTAIASGFGLTKNNGKPADRLQYAVMDVISNTVCTATYPGIIRSTNICTMGQKRSSTCNGDSGGPLTLEGEKTLIGVTSFVNRFTECEMNYPAGFVRVTEYVDYIREATGMGA
ncbi:collagenase-like [Uranotaenia lowii]|uniref:collagenase-like n=1 Tax=Uranotaenia lowii TaxID=190385 RepID=UPI002479CBC3|nr:collagenase-like [Uranotaenia lowii]